MEEESSRLSSAKAKVPAFLMERGEGVEWECREGVRWCCGEGVRV